MIKQSSLLCLNSSHSACGRRGIVCGCPCHNINRLRAMPTLATGQDADLKMEKGRERVWVSRMLVQDGALMDNQVIIERYENGRWSAT